MKKLKRVWSETRWGLVVGAFLAPVGILLVGVAVVAISPFVGVWCFFKQFRSLFRSARSEWARRPWL